jgi:hypothetical protein
VIIPTNIVRLLVFTMAKQNRQSALGKKNLKITKYPGGAILATGVVVKQHT